MGGQVRIERDGAIGWLVFDHEERRNAVSLEMWQSIPGLIDGLVADPAIRVLVFRGAGRDAFVAGADISQFEEQRTGESAERYDLATGAAYRAIERSELPTIAMIHGPCVGGGMAIALGCDIRYSDTAARFTIPAAKLGVGYPPAGVDRLVQVVGPAFAMEVLFSAKLFDAEHALRWGLVNEVLAADELEAHVRDMAGRIAANAPLTLRAAKLVVRDLTSHQELAEHQAVREAVRACRDSDDYREGIRAFMEKRAPRFTGS